MRRRLEERLQSAEERETRDKRAGKASAVSGDGSTISAPESELMPRENLRKFVAAKVFPSWKLIFKKSLLEKCVGCGGQKSRHCAAGLQREPALQPDGESAPGWVQSQCANSCKEATSE